MSGTGDIKKSLEYVEDVLKVNRSQSVESFPWLVVMSAGNCQIGFVLADFWRRLATINGKASMLGRYEFFNGDYERLFDLPDLIESISTEDLRRVAARVFRVSNMTVCILIAPPEVSE